MPRLPNRVSAVVGLVAVTIILAAGVPPAWAFPSGQLVPGATTAGGGNVIGTNANVFVFGNYAWRLTPASQLGQFTLVSVELKGGAVRRVPIVLQPPSGLTSEPTRLEWGFAFGDNGLYVYGTWCATTPSHDRYSGPPDCSTATQARSTFQSFDPSTGAARPWAGLLGRVNTGSASSAAAAPYTIDAPAAPTAPEPPQRRLYDLETGAATLTTQPSGTLLNVVNDRALLLTPGAGRAYMLARSATVVDIHTGRTMYTVDLARAARIGRGFLRRDNVTLQQNGSLRLRLYRRSSYPDPQGLRPIAVTNKGRLVPLGRTIRYASDITTAWAPNRSIIGATIDHCPRASKTRSGNWILNRHGTLARRLPGAYDTDTQWDDTTLLTGFGSRTVIRRGLARISLTRSDLPSCDTTDR